MTEPYYEELGAVTLYHGDCIEVMRSLPDSSVHAVVTDPPYDLVANKKGGSGVASINLDSPYGRSRIGTGNGAGGFMGKGWDSTGIAFDPATWAECLRVLKPGGYLLSFGGTRTFHRMATAVEDAGFEIRDSIAWLYGSGFPKSRNLDGEWEGWGTALKPAFEPIIMARKQIGQTVAANVLEFGTGAINIGATRISIDDSERKVIDSRSGGTDKPYNVYGAGIGTPVGERFISDPAGRWPTNVLLDDSQAAALDSQTGVTISRVGKPRGAAAGEGWGMTQTGAEYSDEGGASRFFPTFHYEAKAPGSERPDVDGTQHPTVKPLDLMRWLVRLVASPGAIILEPFAGSGTTLEACLIEGFEVIGIERDESYLPLIMQRIRKPLQQSLFGDIA